MKKDTSNELLKYLFYKKYATDKTQLIKINHSGKEGIVHSFDPSELKQNNGNSNKILQCYKYFHEILSKENEETRINLFNYKRKFV